MTSPSGQPKNITTRAHRPLAAMLYNSLPYEAEEEGEFQKAAASEASGCAGLSALFGDTNIHALAACHRSLRAGCGADRHSLRWRHNLPPGPAFRSAYRARAVGHDSPLEPGAEGRSIREA